MGSSWQGLQPHPSNGLSAPADPTHLTRGSMTPSEWVRGWAALGCSLLPSKLLLGETFEEKRGWAGI